MEWGSNGVVEGRKRMSDERMVVIDDDITRLAVDAIVNAAKSSLLGGGGVDGAIHRAAGPELLAECRALNGCPTGEARITKGYRLPARFVIHTVGPVWHGGTHNEDQLLANCYRNALHLAVDHQLATIAFPSISTGVYGFPIQRASAIAIRTVQEFLTGHEEIQRVTFVCFGQHDYQVYQEAMERLES